MCYRSPLGRALPNGDRLVGLAVFLFRPHLPLLSHSWSSWHPAGFSGASRSALYRTRSRSGYGWEACRGARFVLALLGSAPPQLVAGQSVRRDPARFDERVRRGVSKGKMARTPWLLVVVVCGNTVATQPTMPEAAQPTHARAFRRSARPPPPACPLSLRPPARPPATCPLACPPDNPPDSPPVHRSVRAHTCPLDRPLVCPLARRCDTYALPAAIRHCAGSLLLSSLAIRADRRSECDLCSAPEAPAPRAGRRWSHPPASCASGSWTTSWTPCSSAAAKPPGRRASPPSSASLRAWTARPFKLYSLSLSLSLSASRLVVLQRARCSAHLDAAPGEGRP